MQSRTLFLLPLFFLSYGCATTAPPVQKMEVMRGVASWYGQEYAGRTTANGEIFDPMLLTAAHRTLPFGTVVDVGNPQSGQSVRVRVNDRGPYVGNRVIDLSYAAAQKIGLIQPGSGEVTIKIVRLGAGEREAPAPYVVAIADSDIKPATLSTPPNVEFPTPGAGAKTDASTENDFRVEVANERRQVAPDGVTVETVRVAEAPAAAPPEKATAVVIEEELAPAPPPPAAPADNSLAARIDRAGARPGKGTSVTPAWRPYVPIRTSAPAGRYVVQVGAFSIEHNARLLQDQLTRIGQTSYIEHEELFRVRLGPFATRELALKARNTLESRGISAIVMLD
jgi:peptidoglycan lytic transglycosylase